MRTLTTALIVRTFNEERHVGRLLAGAMQQDAPPDEVIVVDSGSTDATVSIVSRFPKVRVVSISPGDFSFGRALNWGIATCSSEVAVMASAHVYPVRTSWLRELIAPFSDPKVTISYGRQIGPEQARFSEQQLFRKWFPDRSDSTETNPFCNNANAAVRVAWWRANPYDEELTGLEDVAAGQKVIAEGSRISYVAEAPVVHVHEEAFSRVLNRYRREAIALKRVYPRSGMSPLKAAALFSSNAGSDVYAALQMGRIRVLPDIVTFRFAQFLGGYLGHRQPAEIPIELKRRLYYPRRFWRKSESAGNSGEEIEYGSLDSIESL